MQTMMVEQKLSWNNYTLHMYYKQVYEIMSELEKQHGR